MNPRTCAMGGIIFAFTIAIGVAVWHLQLVGNRIENDVDHLRAREFVGGVKQSLDVELARLEKVMDDWTSWTPFYNAVLASAETGKLSDEFVKDNIQPTVLTDLDIQYWILVKRGDGYVILDIPKDSAKNLPKNVILDMRHGSGFAEVDGKLHMLVFKELTDTAGEKIAPAILVMGKQVDGRVLHTDDEAAIVWWREADKSKYSVLPAGSDLMAVGGEGGALTGIVRINGLDKSPLAEVQINVPRRANVLLHQYVMVGQLAIVSIVLALLIVTIFILHLIRCKLPPQLSSKSHKGVPGVA